MAGEATSGWRKRLDREEGRGVEAAYGPWAGRPAEEAGEMEVATVVWRAGCILSFLSGERRGGASLLPLR